MKKRLNTSAIVLLIMASMNISYGYEATKIHKINDVNSYQPVQFSQTKQEKPQPNIVDIKAIEEPKSIYIKSDKTSEVELIDVKPLEEINDVDEKIFENKVDANKSIKSGISKHTRWARFWNWAKGVPADDGVTLTLNSYHTSSKRDQYNESHNLISTQYKGYAIGYLENSHHHTSLFLTWARKVWKSPEWHGFSIDLQHKTGLLTGYRDHAPNLFNVSPIIMPIIGLNYKRLSADIWITPNVVKPIFSIAFRYNFHKEKTDPETREKL